jgi:hypothetical protein
MKTVTAAAFGLWGARASAPAVFGVSPNTFTIGQRPHHFLNRSNSAGEAGFLPVTRSSKQAVEKRSFFNSLSGFLLPFILALFAVLFLGNSRLFLSNGCISLGDSRPFLIPGCISLESSRPPLIHGRRPLRRASLPCARAVVSVDAMPALVADGMIAPARMSAHPDVKPGQDHGVAVHPNAGWITVHIGAIVFAHELDSVPDVKWRGDHHLRPCHRNRSRRHGNLAACNQGCYHRTQTDFNDCHLFHLRTRSFLLCFDAHLEYQTRAVIVLP